MLYFGKDGGAITRERWQDAIRDPVYVHVAFNCYGESSVRSSWVGIKTIFDEQACLFVTVSRKGDKDTMTKWHMAPATVDDVLAYHQTQCKEVGIPAAFRKASA